MKTIATLILMASAAIPADLPKGVQHWRSGDLQAYEKSLSPKMSSQKVATQPLANWGNHIALIAHREGDGEAELHETQSDVMVIESGEASIIVGGTVVKPRTTAPHEVRGPSIQGGEKIVLAAGDVVHIPIKTPHQMLVAAGKQVTYFVVKVDAR